MNNLKHSPDVQPQYLNDIQLTKYLGVSLATVRRWRINGTGPRYRKLGDLVRYRISDVEEWIQTLPTGGGRIDDAA